MRIHPYFADIVSCKEFISSHRMEFRQKIIRINEVDHVIYRRLKYAGLHRTKKELTVVKSGGRCILYPDALQFKDDSQSLERQE